MQLNTSHEKAATGLIPAAALFYFHPDREEVSNDTPQKEPLHQDVPSLPSNFVWSRKTSRNLRRLLALVQNYRSHTEGPTASTVSGMKKLPLPPYGNEYFDTRPSYGLQIAIGPTGWRFAKQDRRIMLILPFDEDPQNYRWPQGEAAIIHERGQFDDNRLTAMAKTLLEAGAPFIIGLREALTRPAYPDVYFYPEVNYVTR